MTLLLIGLVIGIAIGWLVRRYRETKGYRDTLDRDAVVRGRAVCVDRTTGAATYRSPYERSRLGLDSQARGFGPRKPGDESGGAP